MTSGTRWSAHLRPHQRRRTVESTAAGIYGLIVSSAVMAATHADTAVAVVAGVVVALLTYWSAERYARLVAERIHDGHRPTWAAARRQLTAGWEFVTASFLPLLVLVGTRLLGADLYAAVLAGLGCSTLLLCLAGWEIGALGHLSRGERVMVSAVAGTFGVALVVLKALLH